MKYLSRGKVVLETGTRKYLDNGSVVLETTGGAPSTDVLTADDVQSTSNTTSPQIAQVHSFTSTSVESSSELSTPEVTIPPSLNSSLFIPRSEGYIVPYNLAYMVFDTGSGTVVSLEDTSPVLPDGIILHTPPLANFLIAWEGTLGNTSAGTYTMSARLTTTQHVFEAFATWIIAEGGLAEDIESASELTSPAMTNSANLDSLLADDVESASELTSPSITQLQHIFADDVESASELTSPSITQLQHIFADDVQSTSELTIPHVCIPPRLGNTVNPSTFNSYEGYLLPWYQSYNSAVLGSGTIDPGWELLSPLPPGIIITVPPISTTWITFNGTYALGSAGTYPIHLRFTTTCGSFDVNYDWVVATKHLSVSAESASELTSPAMSNSANFNSVLADDVESTSELTSPSIQQWQHIFADDVQSVSGFQSPDLGQVHGLLIEYVESNSELSSPVISQVHILHVVSVESTSGTTNPNMTHIHVFNGVGLNSASEVSSPAMTNLAANTVIFVAVNPESASELSVPRFNQILVGYSETLESDVYITTGLSYDISTDGISFDIYITKTITEDITI